MQCSESDHNDCNEDDFMMEMETFIAMIVDIGIAKAICCLQLWQSIEGHRTPVSCCRIFFLCTIFSRAVTDCAMDDGKIVKLCEANMQGSKIKIKNTKNHG